MVGMYQEAPKSGWLLGATELEELLPVLAAGGISLVGTFAVALLREPDPCAADPGPGRSTVGRVLGMEQSECIRSATRSPSGETCGWPLGGSEHGIM